MTGKQIKLFLVDGTPGGLTTAEITNWTGHLISAQRSDLADMLKRDEAQRTGAYLLLGEETAVTGPRCYIGEADVIADRMRIHRNDKDKEFWDRVVAITSKDANFTKAHARYLESRLITLARRANRVILENKTTPPLPALPEADASDMDYFVSQLQIVLPVLGVNAIRVPEATAPQPGPVTDIVSPVFRLTNIKGGVDASAQQIDGEFTVLAGSLLVANWHGVGKAPSTVKQYDYFRAQHERLLDQGDIVVEDGRGRLTRNLVFTSPSLAGAIALGRSCNGRREWVTEDGMSFGDWEERGVE